jgi:hypothetical protein
VVVVVLLFLLLLSLVLVPLPIVRVSRRKPRCNASWLLAGVLLLDKRGRGSFRRCEFGFYLALFVAGQRRERRGGGTPNNAMRAAVSGRFGFGCFLSRLLLRSRFGLFSLGNQLFQQRGAPASAVAFVACSGQ